jgi:hypothetical protein
MIRLAVQPSGGLRGEFSALRIVAKANQAAQGMKASAAARSTLRAAEM